ncbi:MAG: 2,4-dihydroxyhept-2-ene-1,7-dioic acid aldolase [Chloroflexi bacterium]|nr:2,4-dihydroxyhept-2-ene-1,7-dioic acid aldolase [Chloroflexota bacterium]
MRPNRVKALWREGKAVMVGWQSTADTYVAETMAHAGLDALVLDMQHGMGIGPDRAAQWLQVVSSTDTVPMVRVPWNEPVFIQWALDAGAYGVVVPLVNSYEEAARAGGACRYAPVGYRSVGPNRARLYAGADYIEHAGDEVVCLVMIEHPDTVARAAELARAPGIDGFYIGPSDLAVAMGLSASTGQQDTRHAEACQRVLEAARAQGLVAGIHCGGPEQAAQRFAQGFQLCPVASDIGLVSSGAAAALALARNLAPDQVSAPRRSTAAGY